MGWLWKESYLTLREWDGYEKNHILLLENGVYVLRYGQLYEINN